MADRASVQTAGKADGLPGQHAFGSFIHNANRIDPMHVQSSSLSSQVQNEFQSPHSVNQSAVLQNGYGASNNYHLRISDMQKYFVYQNRPRYHSNSIHTQDSLQAMYSLRPQVVQGLPTQGTLNPANSFYNQRPQFTLTSSLLQNSVLSQGNFQQPVQVSQGYGQQNQQILALHNQFQAPAPSEHSRMHVGTSAHTFLAADTQQRYSLSNNNSHTIPVGRSGQTFLPGHPQQQYSSSNAVSNVHTVLSEQTSIHAQRPPEIFLPGNQQQCNSTNTSSGAHPVPSEHSSISIQVQRPLQSNPQQQCNSSNTSTHAQRPQHTVLPGYHHHQYNSSNTSSVAHPVHSEHSNSIIQAQRSLQDFLPVNSQQQYSSSNTISDVHLIPCTQRDNSLIGSIHSPISSLSYTVPVSSQANLYPTGNLFKDSTKTTSNNYRESSIAPSTSAAVHITTMPLQQQERQNQSINILNDFGVIRKPESAVSYGMSCSSQGHDSSMNPAVSYLPSSLQNNQAAVQQPYLNNSHSLLGRSSSQQPVGVSSLPKHSLPSESNNLLSVILQKKRGEKDVYSVNIAATCHLTSDNNGNSSSHPFASVNEYNLNATTSKPKNNGRTKKKNQGGKTEFRAAYGHCSMKTIEVSTNTSVNIPRWYRYPETPAAPSFQSDIEAMQTDIISYTPSCQTSSSVSTAESSTTSKEPSPDAHEEIQMNSLDVAHTDINLSGKGNAPEFGYQVINENIGSEELVVPIKQEPPDHLSVPEANLSVERANIPSISDLSPSGVRSISVLNGGYNCSSVADDPGTNDTSLTKHSSCSLPLTESSSHGSCASLLLSNVNISVGHQDTVAADLQTPEGRVDILQLPEVDTNQKLTKCIHSSNSSDVAPSGIKRGFHHLSTLANPDVSPHVYSHAANFQSVPSLIVDSGLLEEDALSSKKIPEKVNDAGLLTRNSLQMSTNCVITDEIHTRLLAKHNYGIAQAQKHLDENKLNQKSNVSRLAGLPGHLQNRRHTSPCPGKNADGTCQSSALRLPLRQSLDSNTSGRTSRQSKLHSRVQNTDAQNVCGKTQCPNLANSKSARKHTYCGQKQSSSSGNSISAKEKVFNTWKEGQIMKYNRTGKKIQRHGNAEIARITNDSRQRTKSPDLKVAATSGSVVKKTNTVNKINKTKQNKVATGKPVLAKAKKSRSSTKQKSVSSICYVIIHGHKLICLKSKTADLILLCEFQCTCFPDKAPTSLNKCIKILKIKKRLLVHPEKETILKILQKYGHDTGNSIYTISVNDGAHIYHHLYSIKTCKSTMCVVEVPEAVSFADLTMKNSTLKLSTADHMLQGNSASKLPITTDSVKGPQVSAAETWQSSVDSPIMQCSDDSLNSRLCIDMSRDTFDSDETLVYGESSRRSFGHLDETKSVENSLEIPWLPGTPKIGSLRKTHLGNIRSYRHSEDNFLADIGVHKIDDNVCHNSSQDRSPVPKRPLCTQGDCDEDSIPHKHPRLEGEASITDSHNLMTLTLGPLVKQDNCQSVLSPVGVHIPCESCPDSNLERTEVTGLGTKDAQIQNPAGESGQIPAVSKSISSRSTSCLGTENFLTSSGDRHLVEKYVNNSVNKKLVQQSENELLDMTYITIDITAPVDTDSCCRNTDTIFDHSVIRQHDLRSPDSDRSAFSPGEEYILIFDNSGNPDALQTSRGQLTLNQDSAVHVHRHEDGSPGCEVMVLPLKQSDSVSDNNTDNTHIIVKSKSDVHREGISDAIICDAYVADTVSNRDYTADVLASGELSSEDEVVHQSTHLLAGLASDEGVGPNYLLPSSLQCMRFQRCVDDMDIVTSGNTSMLVTSSCRKAYARLWQQHRALLGDITRLRQHVAFSKAEMEKAYQKCKYYEDVIHDITSTFKCGDGC